MLGIAAKWRPSWTGSRIVATLPRMSDEGSKGPAPLQPERARPIGPAGPAASAAPSPVNRLHEWAAAAVIVVFSMLVLAGFVYFLRGGAI